MTLRELAEAEQLLEEVASWSETDIQTLPRLYREKARQYQRLRKQGDPEAI